MGDIGQHRDVLLVLAAFSRYDAALDWARDRAVARWGPVELESPRFDFSYTSFYEKEMGDGLKKTFFAFRRLIDPTAIVDIKHRTNDWESQFAAEHSFPEQRPLNLDPGYLTEAKLVLATTKDRDHRLFLGSGIYAEVTLHFHHKAWRIRDWTYPDYQQPEYHEFLTRCRTYLRTCYRNPHDG